MIIIKQLALKNTLLLALVTCMSFASLGFSQNLNGATNVNPNSIHLYTFDNGLLNAASWTVTNGTVLSTTIPQARSGLTGYTAKVQWGSTGAASITFNSFGIPQETLNVTVMSGGGTGLSNINYIHNITPRTATTDVTQLANEEKIESVTYFDGLGRVEQSIGIRAGGNEEDIVTYMEYDDFGRQQKQYMPFTIAINGGAYSYSALAQTNAFYNTTKYENTTNPFSEKDFEASPLGRVLKLAAPGYDWRMGGGHEIEMNYLSNSASEVKRYEVTLTFANNTYTPNLVLNGNYNAGELYKSITKDENHDGTSTKAHTTEEFKDAEGRVILKRTYGNSIVNGISQTNVAHDTYYVYDVYGNLTYVLPPKSEPQSAKPDATELSELCYQYVYDQNNRLVEKKIPGKDWEYTIYNKLDQPIMTQDANLRALNRWLFTKYDTFGRVAYTGLMASGSSRSTLQNGANSTTLQWVSKSGSANTLAGTTIYYNDDTNVYPNFGLDKIYTINYYDNYTFDLSGGISETSYGGITPITDVKGLATGSKVRVLGTDRWITTVSYYDAKARPIYVFSNNNYLDITDKVKSLLSFDGRVLKTSINHVRSGSFAIHVEDEFDYDSANRVVSQNQRINSQKYKEVIVENTYDELGQLEQKEVGGSTLQSRLQTIDYTYNIRGWLKSINDVDNLGTDLFGFELNYNEAIEGNGGGSPLFNGNISQIKWKTINDNVKRGYSFDYDALNRLTNSYSRKGSALTTVDQYSMWSNYDKNGNLTRLNRNGHTNSGATTFGTMDDLHYTYETKSNKLKKVLDNGNDTFGFNDGSNITTEYTYDVNGNMLTDANKGISSNILYNHLNLPTQVQLSGGNIQYIYDATGIKQKKTVSTFGNTTHTEYAGNFIYEDAIIKFFSHPEGYVEPDGGGFNYVYQCKDHLGNVRLSYADADGNGSVDSSEIISENNYYPGGLLHKGYNNVVSANANSQAEKYKYQGQELEEELGKNTYAYQWRDYDPALIRFGKIDRFAEKYYDVSPYSFTANNPIVFREVKGDSIQVADKYRQSVNYILHQSFGKNANDFSYTDSGNLVFNGDKKNLTKAERKAFKKLGKLMNSSKKNYSVIIENSFSITKKDGTSETIDTGQNGSKGDAAVYPSATQNGEGIIGLNPNPESIQVNVIDVEYDASGNQKPKNFADIMVNGGKGPTKTYSMFENFWHAVGHLNGGPSNQGAAMEVENLGGAIRKFPLTMYGMTVYIPATIAQKNYNLDHPKK